MKLLENIKKNGVSYATIIVPGIFTLAVNPSNGIISYIIMLGAVLIGVCFINLSSSQVPSHKKIKSQCDLFDLLLEQHRKNMKKYFGMALIILIFIFLFFFIILVFKREELICLIRHCWWAILVYLFIVFSVYFNFLRLHIFVKMDYNLVQILWVQIENLRDELESKNLGGLKDILDEDGNQKLYHLMLKLRDGEMPNDFSREEIENVLDAEVTIIEQIKVKTESANWPSSWNRIYYNIKNSI